jgi:hypothetical protein
MLGVLPGQKFVFSGALPNEIVQKPPSIQVPSGELPVFHYPAALPGKKQMRCVNCSEKKGEKRHDTHFCCAGCPSRPYLCVTQRNCFLEFHQKLGLAPQ